MKMNEEIDYVGFFLLCIIIFCAISLLILFFVPETTYIDNCITENGGKILDTKCEYTKLDTNTTIGMIFIISASIALVFFLFLVYILTIQKI